MLWLMLDGSIQLRAGALVKQRLGLGETAEDGMDQRLTVSVLDIFSAVFESEATALSLANRRERRLEQVQASIRAHLHEDAPDVEQIARASSMATRTLYRRFAHEATTPMQWLWEHRHAWGLARQNDRGVWR